MSGSKRFLRSFQNAAVGANPLAEMNRDWARWLTDGEGRFVAVAAASPDQARDWPLADAVRASLDAGKAAYAVIARRAPDSAQSGELTAARVFGFTGLETRQTQALLAGGDVPQAARLAGVGYETAREAIKSAMRKAGARRQGGFISTCIALQSGEAAGHVQVAPMPIGAPSSDSDLRDYGPVMRLLLPVKTGNPGWIIALQKRARENAANGGSDARFRGAEFPDRREIGG